MKTIDVFGIGNPLIDLLANVSDEFLSNLDLEKNRMYLVDEASQKKILDQLNEVNADVVTTPGGSCANTMIGIGQLGGNSAYSGKIGLDEFGTIYKTKLVEASVQSSLGEDKGMTGSSLILVTKDGARCMNTHLGMSQKFQESDVVDSLLEASKYLYIEGYLWDTEPQKEAIQATIAKAQTFDVKVSLSLSDPFCVQRNGDEFWKLIKGDVDLVFCNQEEALEMTQTKSSQAALQVLSEHLETTVITLGAHGALCSHKGEVTYVDPFPATRVDTTGAGDAFAAGFLYGITQNKSILESGQIASLLASLVIEQFGPRYQGDLQAKVKEHIE